MSLKRLKAKEGTDSYFCTDHLKANLKNRSVSGGAVTTITQFCKFCLNLGSTVVLARLLLPQDYGLVGMVTVVTNFISLFKDLGLSMATVQSSTINHKQVSTLFWINVTISFILMLLLAGLSPLIAQFYGEPRLVRITLVLSIGFIFGGLTTQHQALLNRQMRFIELAAIDISSISISIAFAISLALVGAGYWALIAFQLTGIITNTVGVWFVCNWRPGAISFKSDIRSMIAFGGNITAYSILNYFSRNLDNVLIGRYWGSSQLGLYSKAYQLLLLPIQQINAPITAVAIPTLSRLVDSPEQYRKTYLRIVEKIALLTMPLVTFMIVTSDWLVYIFLGEQWSEASKIFTLLGIAALFQPISNTVGWLFLTQGRTAQQLKWGLIGETLTILSILAGLPWGAFGVAACYSISGACLRTPLLYWFVGQTGLIRMADFYRTIAPMICASLGVLVTLLSLRHWIKISDPLIGILVSLTLTIVVVLLITTVIPAGRRILLDSKNLLVFLLKDIGVVDHMGLVRKISYKIASLSKISNQLPNNFKYAHSHRSLRNQQKIIYALTPPPHLKNVGDQAQAVAIHFWLRKHFPKLPILEVNKEDCKYFLPALKWLIQPNDVLFLHSGGNLGDRGIWSETIRRLLIQSFPQNKIISLPQTIYFSDTEQGRKECKKSQLIYASHPDLTVIGRDPQSGDLAAALFPNAHTLCIPDFVLSMPPRQVESNKGLPKILLCLRLDDESALSEEQRLKISTDLPYTCQYFDTTLRTPIFLEKRERVFDQTLDLFSSVDAIVTDRYHGLIFAVLCGKPCVVLPTVDHKLTSAMYWFKEVPFVSFAQNLNEVKSRLEHCLAVENRTTPDWNSIYFDPLPKLLGLYSQLPTRI